MALEPIHSIDLRLAELRLQLPTPRAPAGNYLPARRCGRLLFVSGQFPYAEGRLGYTGQIGRDLTAEDGYKAARLACLNVLAHIRHETDGWRHFDGIVRVDGHLNCTSDFHSLPDVLDGASDLLAAVLQDRAGHARAAFGHPTLPLDSCIELVVIASVRDTS